jgi:hypothetical protein
MDAAVCSIVSSGRPISHNYLLPAQLIVIAWSSFSLLVCDGEDASRKKSMEMA